MKMQNLGNLSLMLQENIPKNKKENNEEKEISIDESLIFSSSKDKPVDKKEHYIMKLIYSNKFYNLIDAKVNMIFINLGSY